MKASVLLSQPYPQTLKRNPTTITPAYLRDHAAHAGLKTVDVGQATDWDIVRRRD